MTEPPVELHETNGDVLYRTDGHLAYITLNRPDRGNAFSPQMKRLLEAAWTEVKRDKQIRCVIVTGAGERHFCTGADVDRVASAGHVAAGNGPMSEEIRVSPHQNRVWKPVIAAVNGLVNGGGLHFVVDADIIVAAEHAAFMDTHTSVGMVGAVENIGLAKRLPARTGIADDSAGAQLPAIGPARLRTRHGRRGRTRRRTHVHRRIDRS